ncbi:D-alanyl-D-alanine carboxypeptidase [Halomonas sp. HL-93]|uniref:D-alanyl-D-alanine carboxypeptidase n=1 Tax=Halomonas sp. HL-93 TaxID=1666906 RepID=UPI0006DA58E0|nr:D-alanyl-D-alanine carboxypeptidase [Halomonas sp. HL-93]KPQ20293.1 MAG: D-alanyl-D-alanine carboxypeptidase [Halomonas sp. HL-93]SBR52143.1 D-alanyl-D-alanine carboxypeptidase [Halomonas sp. HL-93]
MIARRWRLCAPIQGGALFIGLLLIVTALPLQAANPRYAGMVVDLDQGEVLYSENADARRYPASLTKIMTLYLAFEALDEGRLRLDQALPVSSQAASMPASKLWLSSGSSILVDEAIRALAVRSANDVAVVMAEAIGGSERRFAQLMTEKARELGMPNTTFRNASGLPDDQQITTARDMVTLAVRVMQDFPDYYHYFGLQEFTYRGTKHTSHNRLVRDYPGADGLKTGFIRASGFNVVTTAMRGDRRLMGIVMGGFTAQSRDKHMASLLDRGFARATLRDQRNWVADLSFSDEYMAFSSAPKDMPAPPQPSETSPVVATYTPEAEPSEPTPEAPTEAQDREPQEDPLQAFIDRERVMASRASASGWGIQVGAFSQEDQAQRYAREAAGYLPRDVEGQVAVDASVGQTPVFRARLMALEEQQARQACEQLRSRGMDCLVVNASL